MRPEDLIKLLKRCLEMVEDPTTIDEYLEEDLHSAIENLENE